jgi:hypothetical protein
MKRECRFFAGLFFSAVVLLSAGSTLAQKRQTAPGEPIVIVERERVMQGPDGQGPPPGNTVVFIASEMNFDGKLVKGAPYAAQAVTESTQSFSDGNRIVNKSTAAVYRDSEGRSRREQKLRAIGPFATDGEAPETIFISDPVAGVSYSLDPRTHEAHQMPPMRFEFKFDTAPKVAGAPDGPPLGLHAERIEMQVSQSEKLRAGVQAVIQPDVMTGGAMTLPRTTQGAGGGWVMEYHGTREGKGKTEPLGKQNIEGVEAEGTRNTVTIAAGEIGNERAIEIVSERWYSPELQTVVLTRHSDPRFGETVYRLTNINRSEPAKSLFEVPADYTVKEGPKAPQMMRMRKPDNEQ